MYPMILKSFNFIGLLFLLFFSASLLAEEKIDIWKNKKDQSTSESETIKKEKSPDKINLGNANTVNSSETIKIEENLNSENEKVKIFGVYDPEKFNLDLNMWSSTKAEDVRSSIKRIKKINLSNTSNEILNNVLLSYSFPPPGMKDKEFVEIKINWLIENNSVELIEDFLKQNKEFFGKSRAVQYLVDQNIAQANIKKGCEKIKFIDSSIKDSYLEKFKIYCLIYNGEKSQARLLLDLLREQNQSDKFFDDKVDFLLGITKKTSTKINEKNLLNFYLSSVTIKNFNYEPNEKTKSEIWKYLNSANLIKLEDINDKKKLKDLELAANKGQIDPEIIFDIYKQVPFTLNKLINANNIYQTLEETDARALIYQKYLLAENIEKQLNYLFLLDDMFKKSEIQNVYSRFLSNKLKKIELKNIPENYKEIVQKSIRSDLNTVTLGKVRYNDKVLHQSKIIKFYLENENKKKIQKDIDKIFKKISKNRKYFYSAKDLALVETLIKDGFKVPANFDYEELSKKYEVPKSLFQLVEQNESAFLALKIVEIIGEDEPYQLDPETIYFLTNLLNSMDLIQIRNKLLISALPKRT